MPNPDRFKKVVVLMGGESAERAISLQSGSNVLAALQASGVDAVSFDPKEARQLPDFGIESLRGYDAAFVALHGVGGEDGVIQAVLEYLRVPYTGSGVQASAVAMDKIVTKQVWQSLSMPTPDYFVVKNEATLSQVQRNMSSGIYA